MSEEPPPPTQPQLQDSPPQLRSAALAPAQSPQVPAVYVPTQDDRTMGMLIHLLAILTGFVGPLILWLVKKDQSPFLNHHGKEALNFQFSLLMVELVLMFGGMVVGILTMGIGLIVVVPLVFIVMIIALVVEIQCCIRANEGQWCRYPWSIRFIA